MCLVPHKTTFALAVISHVNVCRQEQYVAGLAHGMYLVHVKVVNLWVTC